MAMRLLMVILRIASPPKPLSAWISWIAVRPLTNRVVSRGPCAVGRSPCLPRPVWLDERGAAPLPERPARRVLPGCSRHWHPRQPRLQRLEPAAGRLRVFGGGSGCGNIGVAHAWAAFRFARVCFEPVYAS
jgi:hypothetical protein